MSIERGAPSAHGRVVRRSGRRRGFRQRRRRGGVSDVVATILLLALTVTLFAAIFAFVTRFPSPPAQNVNQFSASLVRSGSTITQLKILQVSGPTVLPADHIYLESSRSLPNWQFSQPSGIPIPWGLGNSTAGWSTGQYWTTTFSPVLPANTNITIYILSSTSLLYSGVVPGAATNSPPLLTNAYVTPSNPAVGAAFQVVATVTGNLTNLVMNVSLSEIPASPAFSGTAVAMVAMGGGEWVYNVSGSLTTTAGTYLIFIQGSSTLGTVAGSASVTIGTSGGGGGGGGSSSLSVTVGMSPQPPTYPQQSPSAYFWATVTYPGTKSNVPVSVNFTVQQIVGGRSSLLTLSSTIPGQTGMTISGPSSVTVFSQTAFNFNGWYLNATATVRANATLGQSIGSASGSLAFVTPSYVNGTVYVTTSSSGSMSSVTHTFSHSCSTSTSCPYLYVTVWNNWTTGGRGGPASVSVAGTVYSNITTCPSGCTATSYTISSTSVTAGSSVAINVAGGTTRWKPGGSGLANGDKFTLAVVLTVTNGATTVGYVYDTFVITLS